jgi:hypothetical protein
MSQKSGTARDGKRGLARLPVMDRGMGPLKKRIS